MQDKPQSAKPLTSSSSTRNLYVSKKISESGNLFLLKRKSDKLQPYQMMDRETLYDDNIKLKQEFNKLIDENKKLRSDNLHLQKEIHRYESIIEERRLTTKDKKALRKSLERDQEEQQRMITGEGALIVTQKKQLKELHNVNKEKEKVIEGFKRDVRITRLQETQVELKFYHDECQRLRSIIQSKFEQEQLQKQGNQESIADVYKNDNIALSTMLKKIEADHNVLKAKYKEMESEFTKLSSRKAILERLISERDIELTKIRLEQSSIGKKNTKDMERDLRDQIEQKAQENTHLQQQLEQLQHKSQTLERRIKEQQADIQAQAANDTKEKAGLNRQLFDLRRKVDTMTLQLAQCQQLMQENGLEGESPLEINLDASPTSSKKWGSPLVQRNQTRLLINRKRVAKVNNYDIEPIGQELRAKLKLKGIQFAEVDRLLVPSDDEGAIVSIADLVMTLMKDPFQIRSQDEAVLVARYLVEENQEDWIIFDENRTNTANIVRCVLKNLIKPYELFDKLETQHLHLELAHTLTKFRSGIMDAIKQITAKKTLDPDCCQFEDLLAGFRFCDFNPSKRLSQIIMIRQQEYLGLVTYKQNGMLDILNYKNLFEAFDANAPSQGSAEQAYLEEKFESPGSGSGGFSAPLYELQDSVIQDSSK